MTRFPHYIFERTESIFKKKISTGKIKSYVYALGKHLARVDGVIGDSNAKVYYYHTDHLGSVRVITDQAGKVAFDAEYSAFGAKYENNADFDEAHGFTGKEYDTDVGLYYYNARWYDPDLGRFISEDPAADPDNPNLYSYCGNNPVMRIDPSGENDWGLLSLISKVVNGINAELDGGYFWAGFTNTTTTFNFQYNFDSQGNGSWGPRQEPTVGDLQYSGDYYNNSNDNYMDNNSNNSFQLDYEPLPDVEYISHNPVYYKDDNPTPHAGRFDSWIFPVCGPTEAVIGQRVFGANRTKNGIVVRKHAAIDLNAPAGTKVIAMTKGRIVNIENSGWLGLSAITIQNDDGTNTLARYGEIQANSRLKEGDYILQGQQLGVIANNTLNQDHMLHIELYWGAIPGTKNLTDYSKPTYLYVNQGNYMRRADLMDPTFIKDLPRVY